MVVMRTTKFEQEQLFAATATGGDEGSCLLYVPGEMILSASRVAQDLGEYLSPKCLQMLEDRGLSNLYPQFLLFLKVLLEYEQGVESPYYPWMAALPRKWNTAASMDDFCLSCLPPYIKKLCHEERHQLAIFAQALRSFEYVSDDSKANQKLLEFAYNVVFTRAFPDNDSGDLKIVPMADMLDHGNPANAALAYDENGGCAVVLTRDVAAGEPLLMYYGLDSTNPSKFLAQYGFLNDEAPAVFCKILFSNPSQELLDLGYDPSTMLFYTEDGSVSQEVWDVLLYSRLERKPEMAQVARSFYEAHMKGDDETKSKIHGMYFQETLAALLRHVNHILAEVYELTFQMNAYDSSQHPRLPLLRRHHEMVTSTFTKVRTNLEQMLEQ
jgi:hypothetical protein